MVGGPQSLRGGIRASGKSITLTSGGPYLQGRKRRHFLHDLSSHTGGDQNRFTSSEKGKGKIELLNAAKHRWNGQPQRSHPQKPGEAQRSRQKKQKLFVMAHEMQGEGASTVGPIKPSIRP